MVALARSFYRYFVSGKYLLEWTSFEQSEKVESFDSTFALLVSGIIFASACIFVCIGLSDANVFCAITFAVAWLGSPFYVIYLNSNPRDIREVPNDELLLLAWRTWNYFDQAFKASASKIVPDNIGIEDVDRRSSPTNIGMSLVAVVAANNLNLISRSTSMHIVSDVLESVAKLPTHQGHLYNWYDIDTYSVIGDGSISSADSANFVASVIVLKEWLKKTLNPDEARAIEKTYLKISELLVATRSEKFHTEGSASLRLHFMETEHEAYSESLEVSLIRHDECFKSKYFIPDQKKTEYLLQICERLIAPSFAIFLNTQAGLLHIETNGLYLENSPALYDLLASEARLATFIGVAKSDLPLSSWTRLSRSKISTTQGPCLVSWGGSLFEHLFAEIFAQSPRGSLLGISNRNVVKQSIEAEPIYPWGKSECAYLDGSSNLLYGPIGEPMVAISTDSQEKKIVAPYASMLALNLSKKMSIANLRKISKLEALGKKGLFESISVSEGANPGAQILHRHFSHHQGMILASIANSCSGTIESLFMDDSEMRAASMLLREPWPDNFVVTKK